MAQAHLTKVCLILLVCKLVNMNMHQVLLRLLNDPLPLCILFILKSRNIP